MVKANKDADSAGSDLSNLRRMAYFVAVVETGSFTAAAERLKITKSVVSQQVARLERELNATLLVRTTRKIKTTEAGHLFYQRCSLILHEAEEAFEELADRSEKPAGVLRLTAPFDYGIGVVVPAIAEFTTHYPHCKVEAVFSDECLDIIDQGIELSIRIGWLTESGLQARKIGKFRQILVAPAGMHAQTKQCLLPQDISTLPFVANTALREHRRWSFRRNQDESQTININPSIFLNSTLAVRAAVLEGAGLSVLPDFVVEDDLLTGRLTQVLPEWSLPSGDINVVFPPARFRPAKVKAFVELLREKELRRANILDNYKPRKDS